MLLVLDNCEHVLGPVADLINLLLGAAPRLRILTTSREPVGLAGEVVRPVPPLEVPSAVQLFVLRAAAAAHGFELTAGNADEVAQICRRLDGVPLALELAATRVRTLGLRGLIDGLDDRFRLLAVGRRGVPSRQRTLMATIDWSWQLLTTEEQTVLRRLAVHADGCTREGAEALCPVADLSEILAGLVDRSLVVLSDSGVDGARYRLLESVAAFCVDRLQEQGELQGLREQHRQYYAELALRAEPKLYGPDQDRWLRVLDAENANLRAALDGATQTGDAESALGLVNAMAWYWFLRGRLAEAARSIQAALGVIGRTTPTARGRALVWHTGISFLLGDTADWAARHTAALRSPVVSDDPRNRARGEWFLAFAQIDLGEVAATGKLIDELLTRFRDLGDEWGEAATLALRAKHAHITGDIDRLEEDGFRSTELSRRLGERWCLLQATEWLGASAALRGNYEQAVELQREGLRMAEELGLWAEVSGRLCWLGWIAMQRGDYRNALELCTKGLRLAREQASPLGVVFAQLGLAFAARRNGDLAAAEIHLHELLGTAVAADGQPLYLPGVLIELGYLAELRGDPAAATERHTEAFAVAKQLGAARDIAQALAGLAGAIARAGDAYQAAVLLGAAAAAREAAQADLAPAEELDHARAVTAAQSTLGLDAFATAFDRGRSLSPAEAIGVTPAVNKP
jgi:predicted ATPase